MFSRIQPLYSNFKKITITHKINTTMKKYILTIMLFSLGFAGYAQVGIGTASPTLTLEVVGLMTTDRNRCRWCAVPRVNDTDMSQQRGTRGKWYTIRSQKVLLLEWYRLDCCGGVPIRYDTSRHGTEISSIGLQYQCFEYGILLLDRSSLDRFGA